MLERGPIALLGAGLAVLVQALLPVLLLPVEPGQRMGGGLAVLGAAGGVAGVVVGVLGVEGGRLRGGGQVFGGGAAFGAALGREFALRLLQRLGALFGVSWVLWAATSRRARV